MDVIMSRKGRKSILIWNKEIKVGPFFDPIGDTHKKLFSSLNIIEVLIPLSSTSFNLKKKSEFLTRKIIAIFSIKNESGQSKGIRMGCKLNRCDA